VNLKQIYYLVEVAKTKSISNAAERIYVSQQSISSAINKLEKELGVPLLYRSFQGVLLTDFGELLVNKGREILKNTKDLESEIKLHAGATPPEITGELIIYTTFLTSNVILPNLLNVFHKNYSNVNLKIEDKVYSEMLQDISTGKADLGLVDIVEESSDSDNIRCEIFPEESIYFERLFYDKLYARVGKSTPLANIKSISIKELLKYPLSVHAYPLNYYLNRVSKGSNKPKIFLDSGSAMAKHTAVAKGWAIGFITGASIKEGAYFQPDLQEIIQIPIDGIRISVGWIRSKNHYFSMAAQKCIEALKSLY